MAHPAPTDPAAPARWTVEQYLRLVDEGVLGSDDKVELLEGVIVTMAPANLPHDAGVVRVTHALIRAVGDRAVVRVQLSLKVGPYSVTYNDPKLVGETLPSIRRAVGETNVFEVPKRMGAEDFCFYQQVVPGFFLRLGSGNNVTGFLTD